jgi:hypothetical protein
MRGICSTIVIVKVTVPLTLALDGSAIVFSRAMVLELGPKVGGGEARRCRHA